MTTDFYTLEEAANRLGLSPEELNLQAQQGLIQALADGGTWRFPKREIDEMAAGQGAIPLAPDEPAPRTTAPPAPAPNFDDDLIPFDAGTDLGEKPASAVQAPAADDDEDLMPIDDLLDNPPPAAGSGLSGINLGTDIAPTSTGSQPKSPSKISSLKLKGDGSDVRLKVNTDASEFELTIDSSPALEEQVAAEGPSAGARATGGPMIPEYDPGLDLGTEPAPGPAVGLEDPGLAPAPMDLDGGLQPTAVPMDLDAGLEPAPAPLDLDAGLEPAPAPVDLDGGLQPTPAPVDLDGGLEPAPAFDADPGLQADPQAPRISTLDVEPDPALSQSLDLGTDTPADLGPAPDLAPAGDNAGFDNEVSVDFDSSTLDDSMLSIDEMPAPDSDVRLEPAGTSQVPLDGGAPPHEPIATEEIDLDAELQQADQASMERRGKTKPVGGGPAIPPRGTMLPTASPFELSQDDLEYSTSGSSSGDRPMGSEFELTLAPEDQSSPLNLGEDEDVDLGGLPPKDGMSSSARAELSGINLHNPADSGINLDEGGSDSVDFELTVDDDMAGPKTIKGKLPDSDSEFELSLEDESSGSLGELGLSSDSGEQKDIFETDLEIPSVGGEESHSEAVALDGTDTDLESSDFDLAVSDTDLESHAAAGAMDESGSQVVILPEEESQDGPRKSKVSGGSLESVDELLMDDEGLEVEEEPEEDDDELTTAAATIPAAQAEWGLFPVLLLVPCVLVMFVAGLMSYELLHGMWGYHAASKPSGLVVRGIAGLFADDLPKE